MRYQILGSAYIVNASSQHLHAIYESDSKSLEAWQPSPNEITEDDWRDYLGEREYQRAYLDFFEDRLVEGGYDWKGVVWKYLFEDKDGLGNNLVAGREYLVGSCICCICKALLKGVELIYDGTRVVGHCIIHLGYAFELQSRELAMEALTLTTCFHDSMGKYLTDPQYTFPLPDKDSGPAKSSSSTLSILEHVRNDPRLKDIPRHPSAIGMADLFKEHERTVLEHWNSWALDRPGSGSDLNVVFEEAQRTPIALLVGSWYPSPSSKQHISKERKHSDYDFFLVHLLTTSHALRILLPLMPDLVKERGKGKKGERSAREWQVVMLRQWFLFVVAVYVMQGLPEIDEKRFTSEQLEGEKDEEGWDWVLKQAVEGEWSLDSHFVKAVRAIKVAEQTWIGGDQHGKRKGKEEGKWYLDAARTFVKEFDGWGGFGTSAGDGAEDMGGHE